MTSPVDFSRAQDLLIKLVQALSPLTFRVIPSSFFLNKRFFIPPSQAEFLNMEIRAPVRLLTNLSQVQREMGDWLEGASTVSSKTKNKEARVNPTDGAEAKPISKQAQQLIAQVHDAIAKLTTSSNFKDPQKVPIREALNKIKPQLDEIIKTVSLKETIESRPSVFFRNSLPRSSREHIFNQLAKTSERVGQQENKPSQVQKPKRANSDRKEVAQKRHDRTPSILPKYKESKVQVVNILTGKILITPEAREDAPPRPVERTYLPGAPYQAQNKNMGPIHKKKKRKGSWFNKEEEEEKHDHSD